jgi:hypothetical protein
MSQVHDWSAQLQVALAQEIELEQSYVGKIKGRIYHTRITQIKERLKYIKAQVLLLGLKHNIIRVTYIKDGFLNEMFLTSVTLQEAKAIVKFRVPNIHTIKASQILPGIPRTVK